jgi:hypothetical protein
MLRPRGPFPETKHASGLFVPGWLTITQPARWLQHPCTAAALAHPRRMTLVPWMTCNEAAPRAAPHSPSTPPVTSAPYGMPAARLQGNEESEQAAARAGHSSAAAMHALQHMAALVIRLGSSTKHTDAW